MSRSKCLDRRSLVCFALGVLSMFLYVQTALLINVNYSASLCTETNVEQHLHASTTVRQKNNLDAAILNRVDGSSSAGNSHVKQHQQQQQLEQATNTRKEKKEWAPAIPYRIVIVDTRYKSVEELPYLSRKNVENTIQKYRDLWGDKFKEVWFLGDDECQKSLEQADMRLLKYYWWETFGPYKSDICRLAALYIKGGYYFDTDMQVVKPVTIAPHVTFSSPFQYEFNAKTGNPAGLGLFNSFIAATPKNAIVKRNFQIMVDYYDEVRKQKTGQRIERFKTLMGPGSLFAAYKSLTTSERGMVDMTLAETKLNEFNYPDFPRHKNGRGCCCDIVVHNITEREIYFYSRFLGSGPSCEIAR